MVSSDKLYRYDKTQLGYVQVYSLPSYLRYEVSGYQDRVVVAAANSFVNNSSTSPPINSSSYFIYAFQLNSSSASITTMINVTGVKEQGRLADVLVSPKLTKIVVVYESLNGTMNVMAKHIGSSYNNTFDLQFGNIKSQFLETIKNVNKSQEIAIGDSFIVVRNGSRFDLSTPDVKAVEASYQFLGT